MNGGDCCPNGCPSVPCGRCKKYQRSIFFPDLPYYAGDIIQKSRQKIKGEQVKEIILPDFAGKILAKNSLKKMRSCR